MLEFRFPELTKEVLANNWVWKEKEEILSILDKGHAVVGSKRIIDDIRRGNCSLKIREIEQLRIHPEGFAMKKNHPLFRNISKQILHYMTDGNITAIIEKHMKKLCPSSQSWDKLPKADMSKMRGLVLMALTCAGLGCCVIIYETLEWKFPW